MERIPLSNSSFEGRNNAYLFADGRENVLIDTGDRHETTLSQLRAGLAEFGIGLEDIDRVFLTHWHGDHTGLAGEIQERSGAEVYVHTQDADLVEGDEDAWTEFRALQRRYFESWGMPDEKQAVLCDRRSGPTSLGKTPSVTTFEDGDVFSFDGHKLEVVHSSGHAAGLCLFEIDIGGENDVFSGDALLPVYTPNVGGADVRVERPLEKYLGALSDIIDADYHRAWPGHRDPIEEPTVRAEYIVHHHEERAWRVLDTLYRRGPCSTWTVSDELFGELEGIHILHGPGEAYAHLDHLEREGTVVREETDYRLADDLLESFDSLEGNRWQLDDR